MPEAHFLGGEPVSLQQWCPIIIDVGKLLYLKGNYYWRDPFLTSMIMGGIVDFLLSLTPYNSSSCITLICLTPSSQMTNEEEKNVETP